MRTIRVSLARGQAGATLIEVLVTMVILSVGLLGLAGLQAMSIKSNQSAYYRSQATALASDIADRMRVNRTEALNGAYLQDNFPESSTEHEVTGTRAQKDLAEWLNLVGTRLPDGTGKVTADSDWVMISVRWNDARGSIGSTDQTKLERFDYRTRL